MTDIDSQITLLCKKLAQEGGLQAQAAFEKGSVTSTQKADKTYVTKWDKEIEQWITDQILKHFPTHSVHGEELAGQENSGTYRWFIDPIDGTSNFSAYLPVFCTMICVAKEEKIVASAIYIPSIKSVYWAGKETPTHINSVVPPVFGNNALSEHTLVFEKGHKEGAIESARKYLSNNLHAYRSVRSYGSICGGLALVMSGRPTTHIIFRAHVYDLAPLAYLYQRAGFVVVNSKGDPWSLTDRDLVATNTSSLAAVLQTLQ